MAPSPQDPMVHYRRNIWLVRALVLLLLIAVGIVSYLLSARSTDLADTRLAQAKAKSALVLADELKAERDRLIKQAAAAKPGSPAQAQALKQLAKTTTIQLPGIQGVQGIPGLPGVDGVNGLNGVNGRQGPTGATGPTGPAGPAGSPGATGSPGTAGSNGTDGTNGTNGSDPTGFTFTTSDGTTYDCTPDGGGHYTCTPRPTPTPSPTPTPTGVLP